MTKAMKAFLKRHPNYHKNNYHKNKVYWVQYRKNNPLVFLSAQLKFTHGMTIEQYTSMALAQNYKCAICFLPETERRGRLCVDHCHKTGVIRGLLCKSCNRGLGCFKDNTISLSKAINYLETKRA